MKVTNKEVRRRLNTKSDLMQNEGRQENKSVMLGLMDRKERQGRPDREWTDDIKYNGANKTYTACLGFLKNEDCGNKI